MLVSAVVFLCMCVHTTVSCFSFFDMNPENFQDMLPSPIYVEIVMRDDGRVNWTEQLQ